MAHAEFDLLDPKEAGAYLGGNKPIAVQTLAIWRLRGFGPRFCKMGHSIRYRRSDLDVFIAERMRSSTSAPK